MVAWKADQTAETTAALWVAYSVEPMAADWADRWAAKMDASWVVLTAVWMAATMAACSVA